MDACIEILVYYSAKQLQKNGISVTKKIDSHKNLAVKVNFIRMLLSKLTLNIFLCLLGELILIQYSVLEGKEDKQQPDLRQPVVLNGFSLISTQLQILQNHQKPQLL